MERSTIVAARRPPGSSSAGRRKARRSAQTPKRARAAAAMKRLDEIARADVALIRSLFAGAGEPAGDGGSRFEEKIDVEFFDE